MKTIFLIFFALMSSFAVFAQESAENLIEEALKLRDLGKFGLSNQKFAKAAELYKQQGSIGLYAKYRAEQGKNLLDNGQSNEARKTLEALIREIENINDKDENFALAYKYLGSVYYQDNNLIETSNMFKKALEIRLSNNPNSDNLFRDFYNLGVINRNMSNYLKSLDFFEKALIYCSKCDDNIITKINLQKAISNKHLFRYSDAEDLIDLVISSYEKNKNTNEEDLAVSYMEKGNILRESAVSFESLYTAQTFLNKALKLFEKNNLNDVKNYSATLINLGTLYIIGTEPQYSIEDEIKTAQKAIPYLNKAINEIRKNDKNSIVELSALNNLAVGYAKAREFNNYDKTIKEAISLSNKILPKGHIIFSEIEAIIAEYHEYKAEFSDALIHFDNAIKNLSSDPSIENILDFNNIESGKIENINKLKDFIALKARVYLKKYQADKNIQDLEIADKHLAFADKIADKIRADITAEGGKMIISDMIIDAYEMAISVSLELAKVKNDPKYKEKAYYYSEKSKGLVLLEAFQNSRAAQLAGLPEKLIKEEESLRLAISDFKQQIFQYKSRGEASSEAAKKLEKSLFDKKQEYSAFVKKIEKEHPEYFKMKFDLKITDLAETRKLLKKDQALIEYFSGNKSLFIFKITADEFEIFELKNNQELGSLVKNFRTSTYGYYLDAVDKGDEAYDKYATDYVKYATELYDRLIKPLGKLPKRLIIVPAGSLSNMPFEPLLMEKPANAKQYKSHKYLGNEHIISYNYSATLLSEMMTRKHGIGRKDFLAFAPSFGADNEDGVTMRNRRFALAPLNYNDKEVNNVRKLLGYGDVYIGKDATEERFRKDASKYKIIHFATHGMANDRDPDFSLLAFTEIADSIENEFLYASDLYNLKLNADLVVLSACETGLGELRKGEGVISLARGFSYAGAKSIFTTMWSVNDLSTSVIIQSFYKYLKAGKDKDEALHLAKLDFIKNADNVKAHPFLWAPYIIIGDTAPLEIGGSSYLYYLLLGGGILLIVIAIYLRKSKKRTA